MSRSEAARATRLPRFVDRYAAQRRFDGVVLVRTDRCVLVHRAYGLADRAFAVPMRTHLRFRVASITKLFTATLIMQLIDEGQLQLDQTVGSVLPDVADSAIRTITVRQLLTHTSGLAQFDTVTTMASAVKHGLPLYQLPHSLDEQARFAASRGVITRAGTAFNYNNGDYLLLGRIIERALGRTYEEALQARLLTPLGLASTGIAKAQRLTPLLVPTYFRSDTTGAMERDLPVYPENWWSAGAMFSTAADLARFASALYGGDLLRRASLEQLVTPVRDEYAFGVWVSSHQVDGRAHRFAQRPGSIMGVNVTLLRYLDDALTVVILGNTNLVDIDTMGARIGKEALRRR